MDKENSLFVCWMRVQHNKRQVWDRVYTMSHVAAADIAERMNRCVKHLGNSFKVISKPFDSCHCPLQCTLKTCFHPPMLLYLPTQYVWRVGLVLIVVVNGGRGLKTPIYIHYFKHLFWVVSRLGPQNSTSRALTWIQCKLGKQYLVKKFTLNMILR